MYDRLNMPVWCCMTQMQLWQTSEDNLRWVRLIQTGQNKKHETDSTTDASSFVGRLFL